MSNDEIIRAWNLMEEIRTCMLVTWDGTAQRARPMAATVRPAEHAIYFLTDARHDSVEQMEHFPVVTLTFADPSSEKYVTTSGRGEVLNDRAKIKELWSPYAKAWFDSSEDPNIRVLKVSPGDAEIWDMPGRAVTSVKMLVAAATNTRPELGGNKKMTL
jgi:general stress protein 26